MNYESLIILPVDRASPASQHIIKQIKNNNKQRKQPLSLSHLSNLAQGQVKQVI